MRQFFIITFLLSVLLSGCGNTVKSGYQKIKSKDGKYCVTLPSEMHEIQGLNSSAAMQYGDFDRGISFMVIVEDFKEYRKVIDQNLSNFQLMECFDTTKTTDVYSLRGYEFLIMQLSKSETEDFHLDNSMIDDTVINGLDARISEYKERIKGDKSYVILCLYKSNDKLYQVYAMSSQKKMADNRQAMLEMVKSLEEI